MKEGVALGVCCGSRHAPHMPSLAENGQALSADGIAVDGNSHTSAAVHAYGGRGDK